MCTVQFVEFLDDGPASRTWNEVISVQSTSDKHSNDEEDDFEEVPIPYAGPSRLSTPITPRTIDVSTPASLTSAPSVDDEFEEVGIAVEEPTQKYDEVIRVELGGETAEQKARRIELASRK
jgi:hypothetical protein